MAIMGVYGKQALRESWAKLSPAERKAINESMFQSSERRIALMRVQGDIVAAETRLMRDVRNGMLAMAIAFIALPLLAIIAESLAR